MPSKTHPFALRHLRTFAHSHDDLPAFHAAYLVLTLLAAALFNLGFFAALIVMHMALDVFKYREVHGCNWKKTCEGVVRESIVDISLLAMGLAVTVYLHPSLPLFAGVQGLMLAEITLLRAVGVVTPKLKILFDFLKIVSNIERYLSRAHANMGKSGTTVEYVAILGLCVSIGLLLIAPVILLMDPAQYVAILIQEMIPWTH